MHRLAVLTEQGAARNRGSIDFDLPDAYIELRASADAQRDQI